MSTTRNNDKFYYAGNNKEPVFSDNCIDAEDEVWLFTTTAFFVEEENDGECLMKTVNGTIGKAYLWELNTKKYKKAKKHPYFEGVFVCPCPPEGKSELLKELSSLPWRPWRKSEELPQIGKVTSLLDARVLRQLVRVYLSRNPPKKEKDFNTRAELKAVSHWRWLEGSEEAEFVPGPHHDPRLKKAAEYVLKVWEDELHKEEKKVKQPTSEVKKMDADDESSSEDIISELKEGIFFLRMYFVPANGMAQSKRPHSVTQNGGLSHMDKKPRCVSPYKNGIV